MTRRPVLFVALCVVLSLRGPARAQPDDTRTTGYISKDIPVLEIDDCPPAPQLGQERLRQIGSEYFERGEVLYVQGDYTGAVNELVASYCTIPFYSILKSIGQAYERQLDYAKAVAYLERYVLAVPADAKRLSPCDPDPQDDKKNVLARITVLASLKAKIRVETSPSDATITLSKEGVIAALGHSGQELEVTAGPVDMTVTRTGYRSKTRTVHAEIGKPYTFIEQLEPEMGRLHVRVIPAEARLFVDDRQVSTSGVVDLELPGGRHYLTAEAQGRLTSRRQLEVFANRDTNVSFELTDEPQTGRRQLIGYAMVSGGVASGLISAAQGNSNYQLLAVTGGVLGGLLGTYYGTPSDLALGTSSLTITSSLIGGVAGGGIAAIATNNTSVALPMVGVGLLAGGITGYYAGDRVRVRAGEAAVVNSGALWGTVAGGLFSISFNPSRTISGGLVLSGLGMGTLGGVLLTHYFSVSRGRAALIDASGLLGIIGGLAVQGIVNRANQVHTAQSDEQTANYSLAGMTAGLILGGVLTRHMDEPNLGVTPSLGKVPVAGGGTTTTFGLAGQF